MATVKFWQGMDEASNIEGADKMMIGKNATGEAQYVNFDKANQFLSIQGMEMKPVPAGALPAGPAGETRTMEILEAGTWTWNGQSFVNPSGSIMKLWWDGTTWSLGSSVALPKGIDGVNGKTAEKFNANKSGGYLVGDTVFYTDGFTYEVISAAAMGESPVTNPEKFINLDLRDNTKVPKSNTNDKNLYDLSTISGFYIGTSTTPVANENSETSDWLPIEELTTYLLVNTNNVNNAGNVLWGDSKKNVISRGTGLTTTGSLSPKGARYAKINVVYQNASLLGKAAPYIVFVKKNKPLNFYRQNPSLLNSDPNPISGYVEILKAPFNQFALKKRLNLFNYKRVSKGFNLGSGGAIEFNVLTGFGRLSDWIPVKGSTYYTRSGGVNTLVRGIAFFDTEYNLLSIDFSASTTTILSPDNSAFALLNVQDKDSAPTSEDNYRFFQFQEGRAATPFREYDDLDVLVISDEIKETDTSVINSIAVNKKLNAFSVKYNDDVNNFIKEDGSAYKNANDALVADANYSYYYKSVKEGDVYDIEGFCDTNVSQAILFKSTNFIAANRIEYLGFRSSHASNDLLKNRVTISQDGVLFVQRRVSPVYFTIKQVVVDKLIPVLQNNGLGVDRYVKKNDSLLISLLKNLNSGWQEVSNTATLVRDTYFTNSGTPLVGQSYLNAYVFPVKKGDMIKFIGFAYMADTAVSKPFPVILNTNKSDTAAILLASNTEALSAHDDTKIKTYIVKAEQDGFVKVNVRYYHSGAYPFYIYKKELNPSKIYATPDDITNVGNVKFPFNNSIVVNEWSKDLFAHNANIYNYNNGNVGEMLNIYFCNETGYGESLDGKLITKLSVLNVKDFGKPTFQVVLQTGMTVGTFKQRAASQGGIGVLDPSIFQDDSGNVLCLIICDNENDAKGVRYGGRYYDMATKTFGNSIVPINLTYNGVQKELTINNFVDIIQQETGYTNISKRYPIITGYFPKYNGYYYTCIATLTNSSNDGYTGSIIRTIDGVNWEYVKTLPGTGRAAWELAPEIIGNYLYISVRDVGLSQQTLLHRYNLITQEFDITKVLDNGVSTRTCLLYKKSKLYLIRNILPNYINSYGTTVNRSRIEISVLNHNTLEQIVTQEILTEFGCHYPSIAEKGGNHYMVYTEDRALYNPVSPKQNICIVKLDDYLKI